VPLDYATTASLVRVKLATTPGNFADDPDVGDPSVLLPDDFISELPPREDPRTALAWRMPGRSFPKAKLKVTFRAEDGTEVAGTFTAYAFVVVPVHSREAELGAAQDPPVAVRPAIEKQGAAVAGTSAVPMVLDELGVYDIFGLRLSGITAADATHLFIRAEEVE
jgi:hypothetical protein